MTSQISQKTIRIHILPNLSRSNGIQTKKFGQLLKYNMRDIFLEKSYTKYGWKRSPRRFSKKKKIKIEHISVKFYSFFLLHVQVEGYRNILQLRCRPLALIPFLNVFKKTKRALELVSLPHFLHDFWRIIFKGAKKYKRKIFLCSPQK